MRILVTGGDGFIGRNIVKRLLDRGDEVEIIDNNVTSYPTLEHENLNRVIGDVCDIRKLHVKSDPEVIIHLASVAIPNLYMQNPDLVIEPNVIGTFEVCKYAEEIGSRVIFASTSEVYGSIYDDSPSGKEMHESESSLHSMLTKRSPYSTSKRMGEEIISSHVNRGGDACIVRLFNVVGPKMDLKHTNYGRVFPNFTNRIMQNKPLEIYGSGEQTRSFLHIQDAVNAFINLIDKNLKSNLVVNIGNPKPITINQLADKFQEISNKNVGLKHTDAMPNEPKHRCPNINLAKNLLDWEPEISIEKIIYECLQQEGCF